MKYKHSQNIIFLHVFKDSPFASIDNTRIFFDYYHWIIETIKILKHSNEVWSLRTHPNCSPWGEDSLVVLNEIIKKHFNGILPKNIKIDNKYSSNLSVFNKMSRCVTFSGTSSIESSCYGIKPIIISNNALSKINKEYVLKPKNILEYKKLLLKKSSDKVFVQKKKIILDSKYLLYCLYNVLSFNEQLKVKRNVVSGMTKHEKLTIFFKLYKYFKSKSMRNKFINIGINLKKNNTRTLNYKFIHLLDIK